MSENDDYLRPWASDMLRVGAVDNRGNLSERALAKIAGVSNATVSRTLRGLNTPSAPTVQKIADALEVDPTEVWRRLGSDSAQQDPYDPPAESAFLSHRERRLVTEMIRVLVEGRHDRPADQPQSDDQNDQLVREPQRDGSTTQEYSLAAKRGTSKLRQMDADADVAGEESQDPEDWA